MKTFPVIAASVTACALSSIAQLPAAASPGQIAEGKKEHMMICMACHQMTGMGLPAVFPPLTIQCTRTVSPNLLRPTTFHCARMPAC